MALDQETLVIVASCLLTGYICALVTGLKAWTWPITGVLGAGLSLWWLTDGGNGHFVMALAAVATVALGLRRSAQARLRQEAELDAELAAKPQIESVGLWAWLWHGAGLTAAFASFWILFASVFLGGNGFDGPSLAIFGFYGVYLLVSIGLLRQFTPPPLSRLARIVGRGLLPRRTA